MSRKSGRSGRALGGGAIALLAHAVLGGATCDPTEAGCPRGYSPAFGRCVRNPDCTQTGEVYCDPYEQLETALVRGGYSCWIPPGAMPQCAPDADVYFRDGRPVCRRGTEMLTSTTQIDQERQRCEFPCPPGTRFTSRGCVAVTPPDAGDAAAPDAVADVTEDAAGNYLVCVVPFRIDGPTNFTLNVYRDGALLRAFTGSRATSTMNRTCTTTSPAYVGTVTL